MSERPRLDSWKEIARHLGRDVRTVIRWERDRGLPVHRVPGGHHSRVFAYAEELDAWLVDRPNGANGNDEAKASKEQTAAPPPRDARTPGTWRLALAAVSGALIALAAIAAWTLRAPAEPPQRLAPSGKELRALDASGATRWRYRFDSRELIETSTRWSTVQDLDGDGSVDPLAAVQLRTPPSTDHAGNLFRFSANGRLEWSTAVDDRFAFRDGEYGPPWAHADLAVYGAGDEPRIAWSLHHFTWWPGVLLTLDGAGNRRGTFVNSGWIRGAVPSLDSRRLLVTGISNSRHATFLAVLDAANPSGRSPEPPGSAMECLNCPAGDPLAYTVFPRTDVGDQQPFPGEGPTVMTFISGRTEVHVLESAGPSFATVIYELSPDFTVTRARFGDSYWEWHRRLEAEGRLDHSRNRCPELAGLRVQHWTPAEGWREMKTAVR